MKKYRSSLTLRIFLMTFCLTMLACALTYGAIACLTPLSYTTLLEEELDKKTDGLIAQLSAGTAEDSEDVLESFAMSSGVEMRLTDEDGFVWYDTLPAWTMGQSTASSDVYYEFTAETDEVAAVEAVYDSTTVTSENIAYQQITFAEGVAEGGYARSHTVLFKDGEAAELVVAGGMKAVNQATEAMKKLLPLLLAMALGVSVTSAFIYSHLITRPVVSLSRIARSMAAQDFEVRWDKRRGDEIGVLGDSLNLLSESLSGALGQLREANAALQRDIDRERELERQRTSFFAAASHELKTPVTILKGQIGGMLAQIGVYQDRDKYLARALQVTARMEYLIQDILTISRIEAGSYEMQSAEVDLSGILNDMLEQNGDLIRQKQMCLETDITPNVTITGNERLMRNALDNVLMNAILYSPEGASVRVRLDDKMLWVENTRAFIPEEALESIFQPFYRVESSRNRSSGGSGLGLCITKGIMDLHHMECILKNTAEGVAFCAAIGSAPSIEI